MLESLYVPVAVNCRVLPAKVEGFAGVTEIDTSETVVTIKVVDPETLPNAALIVVLPAATAVARPTGVIVATPAADELHVTKGVRLAVLPFLK